MRRRVRHIHFLGIGGIGMSGLAELLHSQGYSVSGSDLAEGASVERLRNLGVRVVLGHDAANLGNADVLVYSSAVRGNNPELIEADRRKIPAIPRAEMLAEVMRLQDGIAVAGTHGKTTTTSLIAHILDAAGLDPTAVIGGRMITPNAGEREASEDRRGVLLGKGGLLVAEADESDGSFLRLAPVVAVVTNVDPEHLDHYGSFDALQDAFVDFANCIPFWGLAVLCFDHPGVQSILPRLTGRYTTYGFSSQANLTATALEPDGFGMTFAVNRRGEPLGNARSPLPGRHNVANSLAAIAVALELDVPFETAAAALTEFAGIERRFERKGTACGVLVVDDYGHHPAEVRATLSSARDVHSGRVVVVFQPHRYTRTRDCFEEFATAFNDADVLVVCEIYAAGEDKLPGIDGGALAEAIRAHGHRNVRYAPELDEVVAFLPSELRQGDLVITLGAGNISSLGPRILTALTRTGATG
jgi:UDP-N-acetylmuramate--alanine ligase